MAKVFLANKKSTDDGVIDAILDLMRQVWDGSNEDDSVTSGRDFYKVCVDNGEFEGWPQWNYKVSQEFDVFVSPDRVIGKATHEQFDRALTEGKEVWCYIDDDGSGGSFVEVEALEVISKEAGGNWKDYARLVLKEGE